MNSENFQQVETNSKNSKWIIFLIASIVLIIFLVGAYFLFQGLSKSSDSGSSSVNQESIKIQDSNTFKQKYPTDSMFIADIPTSEQDPVRVELVGFSEQGDPNYLFGDPGHWNRVFIDGKEIEGYDRIRFQGNSILLQRQGEGKVIINWKLQPAYGEIVSFDGNFISQSGFYWAYGSIKDGRGYIVSSTGVVELEEGWRMLHLPSFDSEGNLAYVVSETTNQEMQSKAVYKDKVFIHDLISPVSIVNGKLVYSYMNLDTPDTLYLAIDGNTIAKSEGNDPDWLGYGVMLGASGFFIYDNAIFFNENAYDLDGKRIQADIPSEYQIKYQNLEDVGTINTVEGERKVLKSERVGTYWYSETEKQLYPAAISETGKRAYAKPIREPTDFGYSISLDIENSDGVLKDFSQVRYLEYIGDKLLVVASKNRSNYVYIGEEVFGPYEGSYYDSIILPIHVWENKIGFAYESARKLYWEVLPIN
jgi:hypothetical protein